MSATTKTAAPKRAKLYYTPTSCGAASFISAFKAGLHIDTEEVDLKTHKTASGVDFYTINSKGNVPTIVLPDGTVLNENVATLSWIADQHLASGLGAANGTLERYKLLNLLGFVATELHPGVGGFFGTKNDEQKAFVQPKTDRALAYLEKVGLQNGARTYLVDDNNLSVVDIYASVVLSWHTYVGIDLKGKYPVAFAFLERVNAHPDVVAARKVIATKPASI
jgi:glutathione S-transferase